jgi:large subunit ribosomal protein L2
MLYFLNKKKVKILSNYSVNIFLKRIKKNLSLGFFNKSGHNLYGRITVFHKGGGLCSKFRFLDYHRVLCSAGVVLSRELDFKHTGFIGCICYFLGLISYVILPKGFTVGSKWEGFVRDD